MALCYENFGLGELYEDDDLMIGLGKYAAVKGKTFVGYYDIPYLYHNLGDMEVIVSLDRLDDGKYDAQRIDTHCRGNSIWDAVLHEINVNPKDEGRMYRRVMIEGANGMRNLAIVELVHPDVLPSFMPGDVVRMQVVGFPKLIEIYADEDEYMEAQDEWEGKKLGLAEGLIAVTGFLKNHNPDNPEFEQDPDSDLMHAMCCRINRIYWGCFDFEEVHDRQAFLKLFVQTRLGELQLVCAPGQIREEDLPKLRPGALINTVLTLSGDVAVDNYENGKVLDEENDLSLLRFSMTKGDTERLRSALVEDAVYRSDVAQNEFRGRDSIILRIQYVKENADPAYLVEKGTITAVDEGDEVLSYGVDSRCLILYAGGYDHPESLMFIDTDKEGRITRILTTDNGRYHFRMDEYPVLRDPDDLCEEE